MIKVNIIDFHCMILYKDMVQSEYNEYIISGSLHWINHSLHDAMYLARWNAWNKKYIIQ